MDEFYNGANTEEAQDSSFDSKENTSSEQSASSDNFSYSHSADDEILANPEEVRETLKLIEKERKKKKPKSSVNTVLKFFMVLFFPITLVVLLLRRLFKRVKLTISAKTTITFTVLFSSILAVYIFIVVWLLTLHINNNDDPETFLIEFYIISGCLAVIFIIVGSTLGKLVSHAMLSPLRKTIEHICEINEESLDKRLEPLQTKDELSDLTDIINNMLETLQLSFEQQAHFVSDASHELKTPLSIIQGYANLLERWGKDDRTLLDEGIEAIAREAANMKKIIEQLLLLAKLGDFTLHYSEVEIMQLVEHTASSYSILELTHTINFHRGEDTILKTDKSLLVEALRTLIDNAIKYTEDDGVIDISCEEFKNRVEITVTDNGVGISENDLPYIFDRFYRCDRARRQKGSTGLGLTIAKSIIEMMSGKLTVESQVGVGSSFKVIIPIRD